MTGGNPLRLGELMLSKAVSGIRPDVTAAQIVALIIAGIPVIANLLHAFGVFTVTPAEQDSLTKTVEWGGAVAVALVGGDAVLRVGRNHADAKVKAAEKTAAVVRGGVQTGTAGSAKVVAGEPQNMTKMAQAPERGAAKPTTEETSPPTADEIEAAMAEMPAHERESLTPYDPEVDDEREGVGAVHDADEAAAPPPDEE
jgi:hypothetical protein